MAPFEGHEVSMTFKVEIEQEVGAWPSTHARAQFDPNSPISCLRFTATKWVHGSNGAPAGVVMIGVDRVGAWFDYCLQWLEDLPS
jgi:hypothetical protein